MSIRVAAPLAVVLIVWGCASVRDTMEGRESGTSRIVAASVDLTWSAAVDVMRRYPAAESNPATGLLATDWVERLVDPEVFGQHGVLKERARFEIAIAARDGASRVTVRRTVELLAPVFVHPVSSSPKPVCEGPFCAPANSWERPQGSRVCVWQNIAQVQNAPATSSEPNGVGNPRCD